MKRRNKVPNKALRICTYPGCNRLVKSGRCDEHIAIHQKLIDSRRGSPTSRGYDNRWYKYSKWFLNQPENAICKLQLPGCTEIAKCVDHIAPPIDKDDPKFWDYSNHQAACIHCNSKKGNRPIKGN